MPRSQHLVPPALFDLIATQAGVVSREQAGVFLPPSSIDRYLREGLWRPLARGIFNTDSSLTWAGRAWAGLLLGGGSAVIGRRAALHLWGVEDRQPSPIDIYSPRRISQEIDDLHFIRASRVGRGQPARQPVEDALVDAWPTMSEGDFLIALGRACQRRLTTPDRLTQVLADRPCAPGRRMVFTLADDGREGIRSPLEKDYRDLVERPHCLPKAERQGRTPGGATDIRYRRWRVAVELDGRLGHEDHRWRDMQRDNRNAAAGYLPLRFGWGDVHDSPCGVAAQVAAALRLGGWEGSMSTCDRCRRVHPL